MKERAAEGMLLTRYFGVAHPSQPNYVALISGSTAGALTDSPISLDRPTSARRWAHGGASTPTTTRRFPENAI